MKIILENPENENFYLHEMTSFDCKVYICLIMLFFCLMRSFYTLFSARKKKHVLCIFSHTQKFRCDKVITSFEENYYHLKPRHFKGVTDTQKYNNQNNNCQRSSTGLQPNLEKTKLTANLEIVQNLVIL